MENGIVSVLPTSDAVLMICATTMPDQSSAYLSSPALVVQMCPHPSCETIERESETTDDEEVQHHIWNKMFELSTLQGSSPVLQYDL